MKYFLILIFFLPLGVIAQIPSVFSLPVFVIDTLEEGIVDEEKVLCSLKVYESFRTKSNVSEDMVLYDEYIGIEYRGFTSQSFPKKSFDIELRDNSGGNNPKSLLGMPKESDWVLYAPYCDKSLIRNALVYELARQSNYYSPRTRFVEVILNNEYIGVYLLVEKIKRDKNRVNISKLIPSETHNDDVTGGYIFKADRKGNDAYWYSSRSDFGYQIVYPKFNYINGYQISYIKDYFTRFEKFLYNESITDLSEELANWINVPSFVNFFIFSELGKNVDSYRLSSFFYKDKSSIDSTIYAGPLWDFNLAFGNANYSQASSSDSLIASRYSLWNRLLSDSVFSTAILNQWTYLRNTSLSTDRINFVIDSLVLELGIGVENNFVKWPILGHYIWPNAFVGDTYEEEINYLKEYIFDRVYWMDINSPTDIFSEGRIYFSSTVYPNPFIEKLNFDVNLVQRSIVNVYLLNSQGFKVGRVIENVSLDQGMHRFFYNASGLANQMYIAIIEIDHRIVSCKIVIKN